MLFLHSGHWQVITNVGIVATKKYQAAEEREVLRLLTLNRQKEQELPAVPMSYYAKLDKKAIVATTKDFIVLDSSLTFDNDTIDSAAQAEVFCDGISFYRKDKVVP